MDRELESGRQRLSHHQKTDREEKEVKRHEISLLWREGEVGSGRSLSLKKGTGYPGDGQTSVIITLSAD